MKDINSNTKRFWNHSKHFVLVDECSSKIHDDSEKADLLNIRFASTFTDEPDIVTSLPLPETQNTHLLLDNDISLLMVLEKLVKLKANKAGCPDKINSNVLGECKYFDVPLALIYNQSIQFGCVPQDWRDADVNLLFKKGYRLACSNHRTISLSRHIVKLQEIIILSHILELTRKNNTFSCEQNGFQETCSCIFIFRKSLWQSPSNSARRAYGKNYWMDTRILES